MGPVVSEKKISKKFSRSKSMETINPWGVAKTLLHTKYRSSGPFGFREEDFFSFSHCKSMETIYPRGVAKFDPRGMIGTIYVEDH